MKCNFTLVKPVFLRELNANLRSCVSGLEARSSGPDALLRNPSSVPTWESMNAGCLPPVACMHGQATKTPHHSVALLLRPQLCKKKSVFLTAARPSHKQAAHTVKASTAQQEPATAKAAVERGLEAFRTGNSKEALALFQKGMSMDPSQDEARAALYNSACCLVKDKQWQAAADAVAEACNKYGLKYAIAVKVAVCSSANSMYTSAVIPGPSAVVLRLQKRPFAAGPRLEAAQRPP